MHLLSQEVLLQRAFPGSVILQRDIPVRAKSARQHCDVTEDGLERCTRNVSLQSLRNDEFTDAYRGYSTSYTRSSEQRLHAKS